MSMPRPDEATKTLFRSVLPPDPRVSVKPMFGQQAGFVNGNMFTGIFGNSLFVRLPEPARAELLVVEGAGLLEPMPGRPMKEYVTVPVTWHQEPDKIQQWVERSLAWTATLPEKEPKANKSPKKG